MLELAGSFARFSLLDLYVDFGYDFYDTLSMFLVPYMTFTLLDL